MHAGSEHKRELPRIAPLPPSWLETDSPAARRGQPQWPIHGGAARPDALVVPARSARPALAGRCVASRPFPVN